MKQAVVTGGGGFIGGALVSRLLDLNEFEVVAVDIKPINEWFTLDSRAQNLVADLRLLHECERLLENSSFVFNLAADMGGMGFIETHKVECMQNVLINTHLLQAACRAGTEQFFFASSACVYSAAKQSEPDIPALKESDAYPALPEDGYGWEKLFSERMCRHFSEDLGLNTCVARFHNVYGPSGTYSGGREKAPAAICRKVVEAVSKGDNRIEIWGDGKQTRSFMFIDDCIEGILRLVSKKIAGPVNLGSAEMVSINRLVDIVEDIAGVNLERNYDTSKPAGVRGRTSDNTLLKSLTGWEPGIDLQTGMRITYDWISEEMRKQNR